MTLSQEQQAATEAEALRELAAFPLVEALFGRRSRRFALGGEIPDGPLAYRSRHEPMPLTELERMLVLSAMGGRRAGTTRSPVTSATRRTFELRRCLGRAHVPFGGRLSHRRTVLHRRLGVYLFPTRDAGALVDPAPRRSRPS